MKNNSLFKALLFLIIIFFNNFNFSLANDILIDAKVIDVQEKGNLIFASGSVNITDGERIKIFGDEAKYDKINQILEIYGNVIFYDNEKNYEAQSNLVKFDRKKNIILTYQNTIVKFFDYNKIINYEIKGEDSQFDQNNKTLEINKNVSLKDNLNKYEIFSKKIIYSQENNEIKSIGNTKINYNKQFIIDAKNISFNSIEKTFFTKNKTFITDNFENKFELDTLSFDLNKKIFKGEKINLLDNDNNSLELKKGYVDLNTNELVGSDFLFNLNKNTFGNSENDPRLIGRYIITNKSETKMKKSSFTTCKFKEGKCPSWSISADEIVHKKEKSRIEYKNAWLEIYDMPIAYFPYFFHPDPKVERQSGFLFPQFINSSNLGFSTQIPYFKAIDTDKDLTISPRIYTNNNLFIQTEYRQAFKNSDLISDLSFNKKDNSNSHFFSNLKGETEDSFYEMKIQTVSNNNYLKKYQINSPLITNYSTLETSFVIEEFADDYTFTSSINIFEDLSKDKSDSYEYLFPNYMYNKEFNLNNKTFDSFNFKSSGNYRKYNTNVDEANIINDFLFSSDNKFALNNFNSELKFLYRNLNTYGNLSSLYKDNTNQKNIASILYNLEYPLIKKDEDKSEFLTPKVSLRYSPNKGTNIQNENVFTSYRDLFVLDRINNETVEAGASATFGLEYIKLDSLDKDNFNFGIGINLRNTKDDDLPKSTSLGKKTSDLIGYSGMNITENLSFNYNFTIDKNLSDTNYSLVSLNYNTNKFKTAFEYLEKSKYIGDESYLTNNTTLEINRSNSLGFETSKNIDKNLTDYYNLIYKYKNDCLEASIVYNKQFYSEDNINSGQNIFFKLSFIPFGTLSTPNINN